MRSQRLTRRRMQRNCTINPTGVRPSTRRFPLIDSQTETEREDPMHPEQPSAKADARWFSQNAAIGLVSAGILLVAVLFILRELA